MDRKLLIHLCVLALLVCITAYVGVSTEPPPISPHKLEVMDDYEIEEMRQTGLERSRMVRMAPLVLATVVYAAIVFIIFILPGIVHRATHQIYDSGEMIERDPLHDARALFAQGDYQGAIEVYREVAEDHKGDRFPWVEIARIQAEKLENTDAAVATLRRALGDFDWEEKDAAFMMFRLADLYEKNKGDQQMTVDILQQVVEMFPETRHSANATHRLRVLGAL